MQRYTLNAAAIVEIVDNLGEAPEGFTVPIIQDGKVSWIPLDVLKYMDEKLKADYLPEEWPDIDLQLSIEQADVPEEYLPKEESFSLDGDTVLALLEAHKDAASEDVVDYKDPVTGQTLELSVGYLRFAAEYAQKVEAAREKEIASDTINA